MCDDVHLNPVRAGLIGPEEPLQSYPWSSYPGYLEEPQRRSVWLRVDRLLGEWGIPTDSPAGRQELAGRMEARRRAEGSGEYEPRGWCSGSEEFGQELLAQVSAQAGPRHTGQEIGESGQAEAERIVQEELERLGWGVQDLERRRKGDGRKVTIAVRLRRETTMTLAWIAERRRMGAPGHLGCLLYRKHYGVTVSENKWF